MHSLPSGYESVIPCLMVRNASEAAAFYKELFGATERLRVNYPGTSKIAHAELHIGAAVFMLADYPKEGVPPPPLAQHGPAVRLLLHVPDSDAVVTKAEALKAEVIVPPADAAWGGRQAIFIDPFGLHWVVASRRADPKPSPKNGEHAGSKTSSASSEKSLSIAHHVAPPIHFSPLVPGLEIDEVSRPPIWSSPEKPSRPADLEEVAFWPVVQLAGLLRSRLVSSVELTKMYLNRLRRHNNKLKCVVTMLDELALSQAERADAEINSGNYRGLLHGIPWGAKDVISVAGYRTTYGSRAYRDQLSELDATVVTALARAGAVLAAKLATGELAGGDKWFGGRTKNPWDVLQGSSGSSAGPAAATAAGLVGFSIGTETCGSIVSPAGRCGVFGLRPTFGRVSRYGVMTLSWTQDRVGPICRSAEDCAAVLDAISHPDARDPSVVNIPLNWNAALDIRTLRIGYIERAFAEPGRLAAWRNNEQGTLDHLRGMGFDLLPVEPLDCPVDELSISVEAAAFFEDLFLSGRDGLLANRGRAAHLNRSREVTACHYLQSQRRRGVMMQQLCQVTEQVDVYLAPAADGRWSNRKSPVVQLNSSSFSGSGLVEQQFKLANRAGYPALAVPNGFDENGCPTSVIFMARPFSEAKLLAVAKAYADSTLFHRERPSAFNP